MPTIPAKQLESLVRDAIKTVSPGTKVERIVLEKEAGYLEASVSILIVLAKGATVRLKGEQLTRVQSIVRSRMSGFGDDRFPLLRFMTATEAKRSVA